MPCGLENVDWDWDRVVPLMVVEVEVWVVEVKVEWVFAISGGGR